MKYFVDNYIYYLELPRFVVLFYTSVNEVLYIKDKNSKIICNSLSMVLLCCTPNNKCTHYTG